MTDFRLPNNPDQYSKTYEEFRNREIEKALALRLQYGQEIELDYRTRLIVQSTNGARWRVLVTDEGVLYTTPVKQEPIDFAGSAFTPAFG